MSEGESSVPLLGWIVDVQVDFMVPTEKGGRLYVKHLTDPLDAGAVQVEPAIARVATWMREHCDGTVFTGDWHTEDDAEISRTSPDFVNTYPAHCMGAGRDPVERAGAALVETVRPTQPVAILSRDGDVQVAQRAAAALVAGTPVFIEKSRFSVFEGQPLTDPFLDAIAERWGRVPEVVVCGVATDVCVKHAVEGFLDRGFRVTVVTDATWGLGLIPEATLFAEWESRGSRLVTTRELVHLRAR